MKDLTSYFRSNVLSESTNSPNTAKNGNCSITNVDKKRICDPVSGDVASIPSKLRTSKKVPKRSKDTLTDAREEQNTYELVDDDVNENESKKKSDARKKLRRKLPNKNTERITKIDTSVSCSNENDKSVVRTRERRSTCVTRIFKSVVIEDCMNSSTGSHADDSIRSGSKKRKNESDQSEAEQTDSSGNLFQSQFRERPTKTYSKKTGTREIKEENNLFNYFAKAEKPPVRDNGKLEDSPTDCMQKVKVVVQVHSPPKAPQKKSMKLKNGLSPVVKLVRTDAIKMLNFDVIEVIETEPMDSVTQEAKSTRKVQEDEDSDSSLVFTNSKRPRLSVRKLTLDDIESDYDSQVEEGKSKASKTKKNVSFVGLEDSPAKSNSNLAIETGDTSNHSKNSDCDDTTWKMRVQFSSRTKSKSKPKKSKSKNTGERKTTNSSEDELVQQLEKIESKSAKEIKNLKHESEVENDALPSKQQKLAPLFCKQNRNNKKKLDNIVNFEDEARRLFLCSGLPDTIKRKFDEQKSIATEEEIYACYKFPVINHIQQKTNDFIWNLPEIDLTLKAVRKDVVLPDCTLFSSLIKNDTESVVNSSEKLDFDFKNEVMALKKLEPDVNVAHVYGSVKRLNAQAGSIDNICWTDKYKPCNYDDLIGNTYSLMQLKEWIESHKRLRIVYRDNDDSSSEEFIDSDDSSCNSGLKDNVAILVGPPGCGKTCAVYVVAEELGFKVLEVNAASNRNGKHLLDELLEATQSHRVKRTTIFDKAAKEKELTQKKKKKKKLKKDQDERKTMSLILIEDADILFENHDEGFLAALSTLAKESKRPLVFIVNDINYPHLTKYKNYLTLRFDYPSRSLINVWLKLIALTEGVKLSDSVLVDLFHIAGLDVRKSLLQLQMLISSKRCHSALDGEQLFYQDWCRRVSRCGKEQQDKEPSLAVEIDDHDDDLFSPKKEPVTIVIGEKNNEKSVEPQISESDRETNRRSLEDHAKFLDIVTLLGHFESNQKGDIYPFASDNAWDEDSLSIDICSSLKEKLFSKFEDSKSSVSFSEYYSLIRKNSKVKSVYQNTLSNLKFPLSDSYAKYCDFLPALRSITRIEQPKQSNQLRRTSRFFSYLKSVNIYVSDQEIQVLRKSMV